MVTTCVVHLKCLYIVSWHPKRMTTVGRNNTFSYYYYYFIRKIDPEQFIISLFGGRRHCPYETICIGGYRYAV